MTGEAIATVSISVVSLTQLVKWGGLNDKLGPIAVMLLSLLGVVFWGLVIWRGRPETQPFVQLSTSERP